MNQGLRVARGGQGSRGMGELVFDGDGVSGWEDGSEQMALPIHNVTGLCTSQW